MSGKTIITPVSVESTLSGGNKYGCQVHWICMKSLLKHHLHGTNSVSALL